MAIEPVEHAWFLTGATACGKTAVGRKLAEQINAEIVSMDSMSVYRGMDIGTAKPSLAERRDPPHHLIDICEPYDSFDLAAYLDEAHRAVAAIRGGGKQALFVGGTPLYLKGLLRGMFQGPPADAAIRRRLEEQAERKSLGWLHQRLSELDPVAAERIHPNDHRRCVRAIEVYELTGQPLSEQQQEFAEPRKPQTNHVFVLDRSRGELHDRINARVDAMFAAGWIEEVRELLGLARPPGKTARQALGYAEIADYLAGARSLDKTIELIKTRTRQFAKRQMTWFRSLDECRFVSITASDDSDSVVKRIVDSDCDR